MTIVAFFVIITIFTLALGLYAGLHDDELRKIDEMFPGIRRKVHIAMISATALEVIMFFMLFLFRSNIY
jgi:hypothetical protein